MDQREPNRIISIFQPMDSIHQKWKDLSAADALDLLVDGLQGLEEKQKSFLFHIKGKIFSTSLITGFSPVWPF